MTGQYSSSWGKLDSFENRQSCFVPCLAPLLIFVRRSGFKRQHCLFTLILDLKCARAYTVLPLSIPSSFAGEIPQQPLAALHYLPLLNSLHKSRLTVILQQFMIVCWKVCPNLSKTQGDFKVKCKAHSQSQSAPLSIFPHKCNNMSVLLF